MTAFTSVITVLSASRYNFKDDNGKNVEGTKIRYVENWNPTSEQNSKGLQVLTARLPYDDFDKLINLPADYNAGFSIRADSKGAPVLSIAELEFVQAFQPFKSAQVSPNSGAVSK